MRYKRLAVFFGLFLISSILVSSQTLSLAYAVPGQGKLYGIDGFNQVIFEINPVTGLPVLGTVNLLNGPFVFGSTPALALDPISGTMYIGAGGGISEIYTINPATGAIAFHCEVLFGGDFVNNPGFPGAIMDLDFDSSGTLFAAVNPVGGGGGGGSDLSTINLTPFINFLGTPECPHTEVPLSTNMAGIAFDINNILFGTSTGANGQLFIITPGTGNAAPQGAIDQSAPPAPPILDTLSGGSAALQFDCSTQSPILYGGSAKGAIIQGGDLLSINPGNGFGTVITNPRTDVTGAPQTTTGNPLTVQFNFGFPNSLAALAYDQICSSEPGNGEREVGGDILPIDTTALLVTGAQTTASWIIALALSIVGIGAFVIKRKFI